MSNFRTVVERTLHLQLQHFTHFRAPLSLLAAFAIFSRFPIVRSASSVSISALTATLGKAFTKSNTSEGVALLNSLFNIFTHALNTVYLRVRIRVKIPIRWQQMMNRDSGRTQSNDTYATPRAEAKYWRIAGRYRHRLYSGNNTMSTPSGVSTASQDVSAIPLVTYYTPRLLPLYRDRSSGKHTSKELDTCAKECRILPRTFCKWHRMVFQDSCHPTLAQAAVRMKYYSNRDLREIQRIARLLPDEQVFGSKGRGTRKAEGSMKYNEMWRSWLESKGMDLVIVFE